MTKDEVAERLASRIAAALRRPLEGGDR